jgi:hypothetical protein
MAKQKIRVKTIGSDSHTAYIALPGHPRELIPGVVSRTICLDDVIEDFEGPRVQLDFDKNKRLIGIEINVFGDN